MMKHFQLLRKPIFRDAVGDSPRSWDPGHFIVDDFSCGFFRDQTRWLLDAIGILMIFSITKMAMVPIFWWGSSNCHRQMFSGSYLGRHAAKHRSIDKKSKIYGSPLFHMFCYVFLFPDPFRSGILVIGVWYVSWISHDFSWTCPGKSPVHSVSDYCTCSSQNMRKTPYLNPWNSLKTTENYAPVFRVRAHRFPPRPIQKFPMRVWINTYCDHNNMAHATD